MPIKKQAGRTALNPAVPDSLDKVIIDPATKLRMTRSQWKAMSTGRNATVVIKPMDANYDCTPAQTESKEHVIGQPVRFLPHAERRKNTCIGHF